MVGAIDPLLSARGYAVEAATRTLFAALGECNLSASADVRLETRASEHWLAARDRLNGSDAAAALSARAIIASILLPCAFVSIVEGGQVVSLAYGALQEGLLILEAVVTDPACRKQGLATRCIGVLLDWARAEGATGTALQVMTDNDAARALYNSMGFRRDLYGYHYRIKR